MKTLRQRIVDILDKDCEMHDTNCASVWVNLSCDCNKREKVDNLLQLALLWADDYRQG